MAKILLCSEFTYLSTGYATYYRELAKAFSNAGHEVVELASYGNESEPEHIKYCKKVPWAVYLNVPHKNSPEFKRFKEQESRRPDTIFGSWMYNDVLLREKPDFVIGLRDYWYDRFITDSPLSKYTTVILSPTVDAMPQMGEWIESFNKADHLICYNQWSEDWLRTQTDGEKIRPFISPGVSEEIKLIDKNECREYLNLPMDKKIIGTVMRNQPRKRLPELFKALQSIPEEVVLYCHTTYPDMGWKIPELILQYGVQNRVYITYKCNKCPKFVASLFRGEKISCSQCKNQMEINSVKKGISNEDLNWIYNSFDIYVQCHNSEGFGIPASEAASIGLKVLSVDYSAQSDVIRKINGIPHEPLMLQRDVEFNCYRAIPNVDLLIHQLDPLNKELWESNREEIIKMHGENYSWDKTNKKWLSFIESLPIKNLWHAPMPQMKQPPEFKNLVQLPNDKFILACVQYITQDPSMIGSYTACDLLKALNSGMMSIKKRRDDMPMFVKTNKQFIYNKCLERYREIVEWEKRRQLSNQNQH